VQGGLPLFITAPAHGTAYDIACPATGRSMASRASLKT
jgi:4-hydroxy-L-threonine phosphate dehydrogenase PdxA